MSSNAIVDLSLRLALISPSIAKIEFASILSSVILVRFGRRSSLWAFQVLFDIAWVLSVLQKLPWLIFESLYSISISSGILLGILSGILSNILSGILSDILSGILSGILLDVLSCVLLDVLSDISILLPLSESEFRRLSNTVMHCYIV